MNKKILKKANLILIGIMFLDISISTTACGKFGLGSGSTSRSDYDSKSKSQKSTAVKAGYYTANEEAAKAKAKTAEYQAEKSKIQERLAAIKAEREAAEAAAQKATEKSAVAKTPSIKTPAQNPNYDPNDKTPPVLFSVRSKSVLIRGKSFDLNNYVGYGDNSNPAPALSYTGIIDSNTIGDYPLHGTVTDASGNQTGFDITICVRDSKPADTGAVQNPINFTDFIGAYKNSNNKIGIDVSKWQGNIDFNAVKNAGCEFVIMRIGHLDGGSPTVDPTFYNNYNNAVTAGLQVGVYVYCTDNSTASADSTASWVISSLGGRKVDFPIAYDWEDFGHFQKYNLSISTLNDCYSTFNNRMNAAGYSSMLYSSKNFLMSAWDDASKGTTWLAEYKSAPTYTGSYKIWQMSCQGQIPGIAGYVDLDILM